MIVRNEAHVIARCLKSCKPHIDRFSILDTGSTDGTQQLIKDLMADPKVGGKVVEGVVHEKPWKNFADSRNESIVYAKAEGTDYLLVVDADDVIVGAMPRNLSHSHYMLTVEDAGIVYERTHIFKSSLPFYYVGVLHEYLECDDKSAQAVHLSSLKYRRYHEGARSRDATTYLRDAEVLRNAIEVETDITLKARYAFYYAQSLKDAGEKEKALAAYEVRANMPGGFIEETFISFFMIAELKAALDLDADDVEKAYLRAYEYRPSRIEPIHDLCVYLRLKEKYQKAYLYAKGVADKSYTRDVLFVARDVYLWKLKDELAVAAFHCGEKDVSRQVCEELLKSPHLPFQQVQRIQHNLALASGVGELAYPVTIIPENNEPSGMGPLLDRMRENVGAGSSELGTILSLFSLAVTIRAETIVEIGRFRGSSTFALASALKFQRVGWKEAPEAHQRREVDYVRLEDPTVDRRLFSIEKSPLPGIKDRLREDGLEPFITWIDKASTEVGPEDLDGRKIDLAFIDGDHGFSGCMNDVLRFVPMIRTGGYFILHDFFGWHGPNGENGSPIAQVCEVVKKDFEHILIDTSYMSFMIFRKIA